MHVRLTGPPGAFTASVSLIRCDTASGLALASSEGPRFLILMTPVPGGGGRFGRDKLEALLTPRECELALLIAHGRSLKAAAAVLGVTYETARSHMKSVLRKTGAHSQGHLIALMLG